MRRGHRLGSGQDLQWHLSHQLGSGRDLQRPLSPQLGSGRDLQRHLSPQMGSGRVLQRHNSPQMGTGELTWAWGHRFQFPEVINKRIHLSFKGFLCLFFIKNELFISSPIFF